MDEWLVCAIFCALTYTIVRSAWKGALWLGKRWELERTRRRELQVRRLLLHDEEADAQIRALAEGSLDDGPARGPTGKSYPARPPLRKSRPAFRPAAPPGPPSPEQYEAYYRRGLGGGNP